MIVGYGKIICNPQGRILFGKNGSLLWKDTELHRRPIPTHIKKNYRISMSWYPTYVNDLVSCSYWNKSKSETPYDANSTNVGYQWDSARKQINGYYDKWLGNYLSEHEEINFGFDINSPLDDVFVVHLNWYRGGAASIHVVITETEDEDLNPNPTGVVVRSFDTSAIAHGGKALITDGGFEISFSNDGSIENVDII